MAQIVYVGMSGGVDSSVTAALLKEQGYNVVGVYMKNWTEDLPGHHCPWKEDFQDAKRVAVQLGIDFKVFDFQKEYKQKVVDYMITEYQAGRTPNPDIMCNQEVKFKLFLAAALEDGADMIATGHYAKLKPLATSGDQTAEPLARRSSRQSALSESPALSHRTDTYDSLRASTHPSSLSEPKASVKPVGMFKAKDDNKDQTYFLYRVTKDALQKTLFPLGDYTKPEVRELAKKFSLVTATKKESMGICFVGKVGIKEFLSQYVKTAPGDIVELSQDVFVRTGSASATRASAGLERSVRQKHSEDRKVVGRHDGAIYYTIGQRHGLDVGGGLPYYVVGKDMKKNEVYVTTDLGDTRLWNKTINLSGIHWINDEPKNGQKVQVRTRHRAPLVEATIEINKDKTVLKLKDEIRALTPGQSAVIYDADHVLGGGIIV